MKKMFTVCLTAMLLISCAKDQENSEIDDTETSQLSDDDIESITQGLTEKEFEKLGNSDEAEVADIVAQGQAPAVAPFVVQPLAGAEAQVDCPNLKGAGAEKPVFMKLLTNIKGEPAAYVAVYSLDGTKSGQMFEKLKQGFKMHETGVKQGDAKKARDGLQMMMQYKSFHTVVYGASPTGKQFIQSFAGIPYHMTAGFIAHKTAALNAKVPFKDVKIAGGFYEAQAGPGDGFAVKLLIEKDGEEQVWVYNLEPGNPLDGELRTKAEEEAKYDEIYPVAQLTDTAKEVMAGKWATHAEEGGFTLGEKEWCIDCLDLEELLNPGQEKDFIQATAAVEVDPEFVYANIVADTPCMDCSSYASYCYMLEYTPDIVELPELDVDCTGQLYHYAKIGYISGVPTCAQWRDDFYNTAVGDGNAAVGCGPVVGATLAAYYDSLGYENLVNHQSFSLRNSDTYDGWQGVAVRLCDMMETLEAGGTQGFTWPKKFRNGFEDFVDNRGYQGSFTEIETQSSVVAEVIAGRPAVLMYATSGKVWDHFALIVGYYHSSSNFYIYVNVGQGGYTTDIFDRAAWGGVVRYQWDDVYDDCWDAKIWSFKLHPGSDPWNSDAVDCGVHTPCLDLNPDFTAEEVYNWCVDYTTDAPYASGDAVATRPPNLPYEDCETERTQFFNTACNVRFWGDCITAEPTTYTCEESSEVYSAEFVDECRY